MLIYRSIENAGVLELVDGADSKSVVSNGVWVRVPPPAPSIQNTLDAMRFFRMASVFSGVFAEKKYNAKP